MFLCVCSLLHTPHAHRARVRMRAGHKHACAHKAYIHVCFVYLSFFVYPFLISLVNTLA